MYYGIIVGRLFSVPYHSRPLYQYYISNHHATGSLIQKIELIY